MKKFSFSDLKKSSIYVTPNFPAMTTRRYKFGFYNIFWLFLLYTISVALIVTALISFTPAKRMVFFLENEELSKEAARLDQLENKLVFLTRELETIASKNKRLKYAMMLGTIDSVDTNSAIYDSLKKEYKSDIKVEGNILGGVINFATWISDLLFGNDSALVFSKPVAGYVIQGFKPEEGHMGIDYGIKSGTPIYASAGGLVIMSEYSVKYGYSLMIKHENDYFTSYKHCSRLLVTEREYVKQGELIALSGNSGISSSGPHLHFELWQDGKAIDPLKLLINQRR